MAKASSDPYRFRGKFGIGEGVIQLPTPPTPRLPVTSTPTKTRTGVEPNAIRIGRKG